MMARSFLFFILLLTPFIGAANLPLATVRAEGALGYRSSCFDWSIGGPNGHPNVFSELEWKNLDIVDLYYELASLYARHLYVRLFGNVGWMVGGRCVDSDYAEDHRCGLYSLSHSKANHGPLYSVHLAVGTPLVLQNRNVSLCLYPLVGYGYRREHFRMHTGKQILARKGFPPLGSIPGLNSVYRSHWHGPFLGIEAEIPLACWMIRLEWRYHHVHYYGRGRWNLRSDMPDGFHHRSMGHGQCALVTMQYNISDHWRLGFRGFWEDWRSKKGGERIHVCDIEREGGRIYQGMALVKQPFNGAKWKSVGILFTVERSCVFLTNPL